MEIIGGILEYNKNREKHKFKFKINDGKYSNDDVRISVIEDNKDNDYLLKVVLNPRVDIRIDALYIEMDYEFAFDDCIFANGYQSWSESKEYDIDEKMKGFPFYLMPVIEGKYKLTGYGDARIKKYTGVKGRVHGFTYTYIKDSDGYFVLMGSLDENDGFTIFQFDAQKNKIFIEKDCAGLDVSEEYKAFELVFAEGGGSDVFERYFKYMNLEDSNKAPLTGWTSWYNYYADISEKIILENLENFSQKNIPIDIIQIDDGYQKAVGDWKKTNDKFPGGMKNVADRIREKGYKPGIWIAPFVCEDKSDIYKNHPEWILKDESGKPLVAGFYDKWSGNFYPLDIYNKEVRSYLTEVFNLICNEWNFDLIKVDFIFAAALSTGNKRTRARIICDAVDLLNGISKGKMILGCGIPLGPVFGKFPYCRIGSDMALVWEDEKLRKINYRERISTASSLTSTISRHHMNNRAFGNDPDVFILRKENNGLSDNQKHTMFLVNLIFGSLIFTSDNIGNYDEDILKMYTSAFPYKSKKIVSVDFDGSVYSVVFKIEDLVYHAYINMTGVVESLQLEAGVYYAFGEIVSGETYITLDKHESICLLKIDDKPFAIAGSSGCIFPGSEIENFTATEKEIEFSINDRTINRDEYLFKVPDGIEELKINGQPVKTEKMENLNYARLKN